MSNPKIVYRYITACCDNCNKQRPVQQTIEITTDKNGYQEATVIRSICGLCGEN